MQPMGVAAVQHPAHRRSSIDTHEAVAVLANMKAAASNGTQQQPAPVNTRKRGHDVSGNPESMAANQSGADALAQAKAVHAPKTATGSGPAAAAVPAGAAQLSTTLQDFFTEAEQRLLAANAQKLRSLLEFLGSIICQHMAAAGLAPPAVASLPLKHVLTANVYDIYGSKLIKEVITRKAAAAQQLQKLVFLRDSLQLMTTLPVVAATVTPNTVVDILQCINQCALIICNIAKAMAPAPGDTAAAAAGVPGTADGSTAPPDATAVVVTAPQLARLPPPAAVASLSGAAAHGAPVGNNATPSQEAQLSADTTHAGSGSLMPHNAAGVRVQSVVSMSYVLQALQRLLRPEYAYAAVSVLQDLLCATTAATAAAAAAALVVAADVVETGSPDSMRSEQQINPAAAVPIAAVLTASNVRNWLQQREMHIQSQQGLLQTLGLGVAAMQLVGLELAVRLPGVAAAVGNRTAHGIIQDLHTSALYRLAFATQQCPTHPHSASDAATTPMRPPPPAAPPPPPPAAASAAAMLPAAAGVTHITLAPGCLSQQQQEEQQVQEQKQMQKQLRSQPPVREMEVQTASLLAVVSAFEAHSSKDCSVLDGLLSSVSSDLGAGSPEAVPGHSRLCRTYKLLFARTGHLQPILSNISVKGPFGEVVEYSVRQGRHRDGQQMVVTVEVSVQTQKQVGKLGRMWRLWLLAIMWCHAVERPKSFNWVLLEAWIAAEQEGY